MSLPALLSTSDPRPYTYVNAHGGARVLLTCEHAGRAVPVALGDLGIDPKEMDRHIAWDIGAEALTRVLCAELDAPAVLQPYSRLVVDCNRPFGVSASVPETSDDTVTNANAGLSEVERRQRYDAIHQPFHDRIAKHLDDRSPELLVAVHSFTPRMNGKDRPWHAGLLHGRDSVAAKLFMTSLQRSAPELRFAFNEPYSVNAEEDYTVPVHGEARGIAHVLVEVRNDLLIDAEGQQRWQFLLSHAIRYALAELRAQC